MKPDELQRISEKYAAGVPWRDMEREFGYSMAWMMKHLRENGAPRRNRYQTKWTEAGGYMRPWIFQRDELERLAGAGLEDHEIAARLNRSPDGVRQERRKLGIYTIARAAAVCERIEDWWQSYASISALNLFDSVRILQRDIAVSLEIDGETLRTWRRRHAMPKPPPLDNRTRRNKGRVARKDARSRMLPGYHDDA